MRRRTIPIFIVGTIGLGISAVMILSQREETDPARSLSSSATTSSFRAPPRSIHHDGRGDAERLPGASWLPPPRFSSQHATALLPAGGPVVRPPAALASEGERIYSDLDIPPEQARLVNDVLVLSRQRFDELSQGKNLGDAAELGRIVRKVKMETDANLAAVLGAEKLKEWKAYQRKRAPELVRQRMMKSADLEPAQR
jgi:hypothetical protein